MKREKWVGGGMVAALIAAWLSACGAAPGNPVQDFIRQHTECPGLGYGSPQWSPDGKLIYYSVFTTASVDLRVMDTVGGNDRLLATDATQPLLSPDGTKILFHSADSNTGQGPAYSILDLETMTVRLKIQPGDMAAWSPDSQWVAYATAPSKFGPLLATHVVTGETITLTNTTPDGSHFDAFPVWSPDGQLVMFASDRDGGSILRTYLAQADGSGATRLVEPKLPACPGPDSDQGYQPAAWLPDGQTLAVWHLCDLQTPLVVITLDGAEVADLSGLGENIRDLQWSPDGKQILYSSGSAKTGGLFVANADGSKPLLLQAKAVGGMWSPDGVRIVFAGMDSAGLAEVFTINPDGTGLTQLTDNPGNGHVCLH